MLNYLAVNLLSKVVEMATSSDIQKRLMIEALEKSLGIVTVACREVGIARSTHYEWYSKDEDYKKGVDDVQDIALDFAEGELHKQIKEGEVSSTIFYLKTKGKKRGYIEKQEHELTGANGGPVQITGMTII